MLELGLVLVLIKKFWARTSDPTLPLSSHKAGPSYYALLVLLHRLFDILSGPHLSRNKAAFRKLENDTYKVCRGTQPDKRLKLFLSISPS